jgi:polyhydroxyalkanoate synthesis regulator phasin
MNEHRRQILDMLAGGKITADEAERLLSALDREPASTAANGAGEGKPKTKPRYLRVLVQANEDSKDPVRANIRVPMQLLRAGVRLASLIPVQARNHVNDALREQGIQADINQIRPENLEELVDQLDELTVDVDQKNTGTKVRVYCE